MELKVLDRPDQVETLLANLVKVEVLAYDCETTGLSARDEVIGYSLCWSEEEAYYVILSKWVNGQLTHLPGMREASQPLIEALATKQLICHNAIFDCKMAEAFFKVRLIDALHTDTMALAHLLNENRPKGLKSLAKAFFGEDATLEEAEMKASVQANGGLLTKTNYEMYKADAYLMGKYGAKDALLTYKLFNILIPELYTQELAQFFYEEETMPLMRTITYELNTIGLQVDVDKLAILKKTLQAECLEAKAFIYQEIDSHIKDKYSNKKKFNIGASQQLAWLLFGKLGLEFATLTDVGKEVCRQLGLKLPYTAAAKRTFIHECQAQAGQILQPAAIINGKKKSAKKFKEPWAYIKCDKATLSKYASQYKWIAKLLEYQRKNKLLTTYVEGIEERMAYGIINPEFLQTGTTSGRYSSRNPNFQNLPRDDKRIKECIVARTGKIFVGADYSQLEPRVFAFISQDEKLMAAFEGSDDFYSVIGIETFSRYDATPQKEGSPNAFGVKYKKERDLAKVIALASTYGANAHRLSSTTGKSIDETQEIINRYFNQFPKVRQMQLDAHNEAKKYGLVKNLFGRPRRMPEAMCITKLFGNGEVPYEYRTLLNLAVNHRIQSTGASIVNRAAIQFKINANLAGLKTKVVVQVHDSLIIECPENEAEDVALLLQDAMENTVQLPGVKLEAIPKIGRTLAEV